MSCFGLLPDCNLFPDFNKRQWLVFIIHVMVEFLAGTVFSIQTPFYVWVARKRDITAMSAAFVLPMYPMILSLLCPAVGRRIDEVGPKFAHRAGPFLLSLFTLCFAFVDRASSNVTFLVFSYLLRVGLALGQAMFFLSYYCILEWEFPMGNLLGKVIPLIVGAYGLGILIGPGLGGMLYEWGGLTGGFEASFIFVAIFMLIMWLILCIKIYPIEFYAPSSENLTAPIGSPYGLHNVWNGLYISTISMATVGWVMGSFMRFIYRLNLTHEERLLDFLAYSLTLALGLIIWYLIATSMLTPTLTVFMGSVVLCIGLGVLGPFPWTSTPLEQWMIKFGMVCIGVGVSCNFVSSLLHMHQFTFTPSHVFYTGVISSWFTGYCSANVIAEVIEGMEVEHTWFRVGIFVLILLHIPTIIHTAWTLIRDKRRPQES